MLQVFDSDTVELPFEHGNESVRLIGIDTPETYPETEPFGPEASAFTGALLSGREVYAQLGVEERDRHERVLAYLYLEDPAGDWQSGSKNFRQVNLEIVRAGLEDPLIIPPNSQFSEMYTQAAREARAEGRGMWGN